MEGRKDERSSEREKRSKKEKETGGGRLERRIDTVRKDENCTAMLLL
jgi:hypothetical protein